MVASQLRNVPHSFPHGFPFLPFLPFLPCRERHSVAHSGLAHMIAGQSSGFCQHSSAPDLSASLCSCGGTWKFLDMSVFKRTLKLGSLSISSKTNQIQKTCLSDWQQPNQPRDLRCCHYSLEAKFSLPGQQIWHTSWCNPAPNWIQRCQAHPVSSRTNLWKMGGFHYESTMSHWQHPL